MDPELLIRMLVVFAEFERAIITSRILAGQARARLERVWQGLGDGRSTLTVAGLPSCSSPL